MFLLKTHVLFTPYGTSIKNLVILVVSQCYLTGSKDLHTITNINK